MAYLATGWMREPLGVILILERPATGILAACQASVGPSPCVRLPESVQCHAFMGRSGCTVHLHEP
jgi:hypothetical protein